MNDASFWTLFDWTLMIVWLWESFLSLHCLFCVLKQCEIQDGCLVTSSYLMCWASWFQKRRCLLSASLWNFCSLCTFSVCCTGAWSTFTDAWKAQLCSAAFPKHIDCAKEQKHQLTQSWPQPVQVYPLLSCDVSEQH